jgi:hypothetical protein
VFGAQIDPLDRFARLCRSRLTFDMPAKGVAVVTVD